MVIHPVNKIGSIEIDASIKEEHYSELAVTDNPIETGELVSDHAFMQPREITITGGVSNYPIADRFTLLNGAVFTRASSAWQQLLDLQESATPFDLSTGLKQYKNVVIMTLEVAQDKDTFNILLFTAILREINFIDALSVPEPADKFTDENAGDKTTSTSERGQVDAPPPDNPTLSSTLFDWKEGIQNAF